jgi:integrase
MPHQAPLLRVPKYRRHKPTGQAVVTLAGRDIYLGKWGTKASRTEYDRLIGEWLAGGRCPAAAESALTVAELAAAYLRFAKGYYRKGGRPTRTLERIKIALRAIKQNYAAQPVDRFGPLALKAVQQALVDRGLARPYVNCLIDQIRRTFKWGVAQEIVPEPVWRALCAVPGLRRGRTAAREPEPISPVDDAVVEATLPHLPEVVADMVRFQRLTGCRPAEVCILRPIDIDTTGDVWLYRPAEHKTEHHDRARVICIGPKAQDVLRRYLLRPEASYCFQPSESERKRLAELHARRTTPLSCGNRPGTNRKRRPKKRAGDCYTTSSYRRAVHRTVDLINRKRAKEAAETGGQPELLPKWSPNRLRHTAATEIRRQYGLEAAQVILGHAHASVTQVYAERDLNLAAEIMRKIG